MKNPKMPTGWKEVELGEACEIKRGETITKKQTTEGNVPVIAGGRQPAYYHDKPNRESPIITVSGSGDAGYVNFFNEPIFASDCSTIKPKNDGKLNIKFVYYVLKSRQDEIYKLRSGTAIPHVYPKNLQHIKIFIPHLNVQNKIVSKLKKIEKISDSYIREIKVPVMSFNLQDENILKLEKIHRMNEQLKQNISNNESLIFKLKNAIFSEAFEKREGWKEVELMEVADFKRGPFGSSVKKSVCLPKGVGKYKLYEQGNVINNDFERGTYYLSEEKFKELSKFEILKGDLLLTCAGTLGKIAIVPDEFEKGVFNSALMRIRVNEKKAKKEFMRYYFLSPYVQNKINQKSVGVAMKNLFSTKILRQHKFCLPPLNIQNKIVDKIEKLMKLWGQLKTQLKENKTYSEKLMGSVLSGIFKG